MTVYTRKEIVEAEQLKDQYYNDDCDFIDSEDGDEYNKYPLSTPKLTTYVQDKIPLVVT
jgi:hypothetical protein